MPMPFLESGPEARIQAFAAQYKVPIEELFWYGQGDALGLAYLIDQQATPAQIKASRQALDAQLAAAAQAIGGSSSPVALATNAALIVFREGLEAVLILASLMAGFKSVTQRRLRKPMWWGVGRPALPASSPGCWPRGCSLRWRAMASAWRPLSRWWPLRSCC
ncbi:MAG: hypothetical protein R2932_50790 [Caldilineaceae bacterium]